MDALQAAQRIYDNTIRNLAGQEIELDVTTSLEMATFCAALAQAEQLKRIADASERQAAAVERRNELLEEYNKVSREQHIIYRSEVIDFLRQFFQAAEAE